MYNYAKNVSIKNIVLIGIVPQLLLFAPRLCKHCETSVRLSLQNTSLDRIKALFDSVLALKVTVFRILTD